MKILEIVRQNKSEYINKWFQAVIKTYPSETAKFLFENKDTFANPVGSNIFKGIEGLFNELIRETMNKESILTYLDPIIRIRAVQDFTPLQTVAIIFALKPILREMLEKKCTDLALCNELFELSLRIDTIGMMGFDIYVQCKEKLYAIRANQGLNRAYKTFKKAGLLVEDESSNNPPDEKK